MKRFYIFLAIAVISVTFSKAQNIGSSEMLMFSQNYPWGTARAMGLGGAFGALGADQSALSINPAGIGVYRTSDLSLSLSFNNNNADASLWGNKTNEINNKLNLGNIGYVYTNNTNKEEGWVSFSMGLAYNRLNDFNRSVIMKNSKATSSLLDEFVYYANGEVSTGNPNPVSVGNLYEYYEGLAYEYYALDNQLFNDGSYHSDFTIDYNRYGQSMERRRTSKGGIGEYVISMGGNYSNTFYLGGTIGIQSLRYEEIYDHTEDTRGISNFPNLRSFTFSEHRSANGSGFNFKLGAIYKPIDLIRLGIAFHTPTFYKIESEFYTSIETNLDPAGGTAYHAGTSQVRTQNNTLQTPWKTILSAALVVPKFGLLSIDYERANYKKLHLSGDDIDMQNEDVNDLYKSVNNLRVGAEVKVIGDLSIRGGLGLYSTPYKDSNLSSVKSTTYSAGLGYRGKNFYFDLAYSILSYPEKYLLYEWTEIDQNNTPIYKYDPVISNIDYTLNRVVATIGFKF